MYVVTILRNKLSDMQYLSKNFSSITYCGQLKNILQS